MYYVFKPSICLFSYHQSTAKNRGIDLAKLMPVVKQQLSRLEGQIFPNQNMHYILLDSDFDSVFVFPPIYPMYLTYQ